MTAIVALSSGALPSGVAVLRVSGHPIDSLIESVCDWSVEPRKASLRNLLHPQSGELIDQCLILTFPAPASFTGEDIVEFHCHGGLASVDAVLSMLTGCFEIRLAEAGEFSRRAFENGKLDLTEIEGLADLIDAQTDIQRRAALEQASGRLRRQIDEWREKLVEARALLEASFDFAEEDDVPDDTVDQVNALREELILSIRLALAKSSSGEIIRDGYRVALTGPPNAGKSSLLNSLAGRDIAIVTDIPGTTRDVLETRLNIDGFLVRLFDTAGIRATDDSIEAEGIRRAKGAAMSADLTLWLSPADNPSEPPEGIDAVTVVSKSDLAMDGCEATGSKAGLKIDTVSGSGLDPLLVVLRDRLQAYLPVGGAGLVANNRQRSALMATLQHLESSLNEKPLELIAEDLRRAGVELGRLSGAVDVEDLLDVIFSRFCVGK